MVRFSNSCITFIFNFPHNTGEVIFSFSPRSTDVAVPSECAIKIFKTTLNEFKNRDVYIRGDFRFKMKISKQNPRKLVRLWAEKEMHNLNRLSRGGVKCPSVVMLKKHVLIMSFIGEDMVPAPKLHEVHFSQAQLESAYHQCIKVRGLS